LTYHLPPSSCHSIWRHCHLIGRIRSTQAEALCPTYTFKSQVSAALDTNGFQVDMELHHMNDQGGSGSPPDGAAADGGLLAVQEAALRQLAQNDPEFEIAVSPSFEKSELRWRLALQFPGETRQLRLVDARLRDRNWKQLNALARFVCRICGSERRLIVSLKGIDPALLTTRGE
jgi:hypothetical protein